MLTTVTESELTDHAHEIVSQAKQGGTLVVSDHGEEQVAILDVVAYRLLQAVAHYQSRPLVEPPQGLTETEVGQTVQANQGDVQTGWNLIIHRYFSGNISLGRAARLLNISRFELQAHFHQLGLPLWLGAADSTEALAELQALRD